MQQITTNHKIPTKHKFQTLQINSSQINSNNKHKKQRITIIVLLNPMQTFTTIHQ